MLYRPGEHGTFTPPVQLYPAAHAWARGDVDPGLHSKPSAHTPLHSGDVTPVPLPYRPDGHGDSAPSTQYEPGGHSAWADACSTVGPPRE